MKASGQIRRALAEAILEGKDPVARSITDEFLERHPEWLDRYGERARIKGVEDAVFHAEFLAGAVMAGSPTAFADYARWTAKMLSARGIDPTFVVENIEQLGEAYEADPSPEGTRLIHEYVEAARSAILQTGEAAEQSPEAEDEELRLAREVYLQATLLGDRRAAFNVVEEALRRGATHPEIYTRVLQEAQYEVGRRWESNEISVAEEHIATAVTQYVLARLYESLPRPGRERGRAVITGVAGELHQVGANMVADRLEMDGWNVRFVGTDLPHRDIVDVIEESEADLVGISMTILSNLTQGSDLVASIRQRMGPMSPRILVGGAAFRASPGAWKELRADRFATDLDDAVKAAREMKNDRGVESGSGR